MCCNRSILADCSGEICLGIERFGAMRLGIGRLEVAHPGVDHPGTELGVVRLLYGGAAWRASRPVPVVRDPGARTLLGPALVVLEHKELRGCIPKHFAVVVLGLHSPNDIVLHPTAAVDAAAVVHVECFLPRPPPKVLDLAAI